MPYLPPAMWVKLLEEKERENQELREQVEHLSNLLDEDLEEAMVKELLSMLDSLPEDKRPQASVLTTAIQ